MFRTINVYVFVLICVLSFAVSIWKDCQWLNFVYILAMIIYFIYNSVTEIVTYPDTALKRRKGFLDNSLGTKLLEREIKNYFSNDSIQIGPYKMMVNCYENCFFIYHIADAMTIHLVIKNTIALVFFLLIAYVGFQDNAIAVPGIQVFFSTLFLQNLFHHFFFKRRLRTLLASFQQFFTSKMEKDDLGYPICFVLDYETILAYNKSPLSDKKFQELDPVLSKEWEDKKTV